MNRLKELRLEKKMSQLELANFLNLSQQTISGYEKETRVIDTEKAKLIADFFNASIDYLLGRSDIKNPEELLTIDKKSALILSDPDMKALFQDYDNWSDEDKKELIAYLKIKKILRNNKVR